jgi:methylmalonyl-CoA mutase N-terminal domain/subunit
MKTEYGASDRSCWLRFHTQTGGSTLTAQQPMNNTARVTIQAMAAVLGGTQSLHTNGFDEASNLPTTDTAKLALRTQQIIAYESGITSVPDPMAGSFYLEELTDKMVEVAQGYLDRITVLGGASKAVEFMQKEIAATAYVHQKNIEKGKKVVVGVNRFVEDKKKEAFPETADYFELERSQCLTLKEVKAKRDKKEIEQACDDIRLAVRSGQNLMPFLIEAVKANVTLGEISKLLILEWGEYQP